MAGVSWILRNVRLLLAEGEQEGDAWIDKGRWAAIGRVPDRARGLNLEGKGAYLLPGLIDTHVHFREPGLTHKGNFYTESRAALAGGVTTVFDMPNTLPPTTTLARWEAKKQQILGRSWVNFALYFGATLDNAAEIARLDPKQVPGVKVFLASSTGDLLVDSEAVIEHLARVSPVRLVFHSERQAIIEAAAAQWRGKDWEEVPDLHLRRRPPEACIASTRWLLGLATQSAVPFHLLHITTAGEVELLRQRPPNVSAETCPVYLTWSAGDFPHYRNLLKCNPALKSEGDRRALWEGLREGVLEVVGTDHAPHTWAEKHQPYEAAPAGVPAHGYLLPWLWTIGGAWGVGLNFWVEKMVYAPARLWRLQARGPIQEGYWADAVLFNPMGQTQVPPAGSPYHYTRCAWSPLEGRTLAGEVQAVWVNGELSFWRGYFCGSPAGQPVVFA
ncbi:MAG: amidohydrolase family protein [Bacteroidia bacterium]|nr:amidohydrolase family protein [Bacteroidia bacterium]MDW8088666.1 amidohydrolase family protein [Bacteroidia bacterium]